MKYHVAHIAMSFAEEWQKDLFVQQLFDAGFDTFDGENAYIPSDLWTANKTNIEQLFNDTNEATITSVEPCPDENWNAVWESEHPVQQLPLDIQIIPHCAFGAGHHGTTAMMIDNLMKADLKGKHVLDHGTGTGVLAIFAKKLGAAHVVALDIDEKSVENAKENAALNKVDIDVRLCTSELQTHQTFDLILANIHRNILLANMPAYAACMNKGSQLWLSGFYENDIPVLIDSAHQYNIRNSETISNGEWRMIKLIKD